MYKLFFYLLFSPIFVLAKDFGTEGHVFPVLEENLKEYLQKKLKPLSEERIETKLIQAARNPKPLQLSEARVARSFTYDPTYILPETIQGADGEIIASKGDKTNPLEHVELDEGLLFFDGSNPKHVKWAEFQSGKFLWILVNGSPLELEEEKERPIYFDQGGHLCEKFGIQHIPSRVTQKEKQLLIEEIPIQKEKK
ncbi:conjugal transfer pore protein TraW [Simkania negevensis]|uniref:Conjugal transfer pore protein TraW n=1 Tax=Simkania negevensis (strain ATCC VR-1471 / DSM 27360 / Z) TaxID=331113 RepID=F8L2Y6_SIMNZ|nr:conjugal transfer pore protein TraW [Simkania negevensis]CCB87832.1 conjugal transfer pore protein TraW [Simkania negevensis Z]